MLLQWIWQISFPRLVHITTSSSYSSFLVLFLPSLLQVVIRLSSVLVNWFTQEGSPVLAFTVRLYSNPISKGFAYVKINSRQFGLCPLHSHSSLIWESHNVQSRAGLFSLLLHLSGTHSAISSSSDVSLGPCWPWSLWLLSDAAGSSHVKYSIGASSSEEVMLQLVVSTPHSGWTSFTRRSIPSTRTKCGLYTPVIVPFPNWVVHRPCGILTQTLSPTS